MEIYYDGLSVVIQSSVHADPVTVRVYERTMSLVNVSEDMQPTAVNCGVGHAGSEETTACVFVPLGLITDTVRWTMSEKNLRGRRNLFVNGFALRGVLFVLECASRISLDGLSTDG